MTNPERDVIASIDALEAEWAEADQVINHNLRANRGFDNYDRPWHDRRGEVLCTLCMEEWHGLQKDNCPGEFATEAEKEAYRGRHRPRTHIDMSSRTHHRNRLRGELDSFVTTDTSRWPVGAASGLGAQVGIIQPEIQHGAVITVASPEMQAALVEHVTRYPEDEESLMRRFRDLIFTPDGRPVPWTQGGLRTVLGGDEHRVRWAQRQLGIVDLGAVGEDGLATRPPGIVE